MDLLLALGLPLVLLMLAVLALEQQGPRRLPGWLRALQRRQPLIWNTGIGLVIGLSLLRWLLHR
jgi:hypothetical protein